jgi:hypothetical protein
MPRYHLHLRFRDRLVKDEEGAELPDLEAARHEARQTLRDLAAEDISAGRSLRIRSVEICDEDGRDIATVSVAAAISATLPVSEDTFEIDLRRYYDSKYNPCKGDEWD